VCTYTDATDSTFTYTDGDTLQIEIGAPANCSAAGTVGGLQYPATVSSSAGIVDLDSGFGWNLTDSTDKTYE
jgi:hypothetical protein